MTIKFLRIKDVMTRLRKGRSAIYADAKNGTLPPPINIGARERMAVFRDLPYPVGEDCGGSAEAIRILVTNFVEARVSNDFR